jgi:CBS domain-containing protein
MMSVPIRSCRIYRGHGEPTTESLDLDDDVPIMSRAFAGHSTIANRIPLREIMCRNLVCARPDLDIESVIDLMVRNHLGCIPVVDEQRRPLGVITKFDIVENVDAFLRSASNGSPMPIDLLARSADEAMMPIALTLEQHSSVADAALMMTCEDLHHVLVVSANRALVGIVSSKDIVTWLVENDAVTPRGNAS